jgi:cysteinyl-tRNA synthetase
MPYIKVLSKFRDDIRNKAIAKAPYQDFLTSTDRVRNFDLLELGFSLDDRPDAQSALIKFVNSQEKAELIQQRDEKVQREQLKLAKKAEQAKLEEAKRIERLTKAKIPPNEMFKDSLEYREFDEEGVPTVDRDGEPVSKSSRKKLVKLYEAQKKLHQDYLSNNL